MNFTKLTDNLLKTMDRYVYRPFGRRMDRVGELILSDKFVKLAVVPSIFAMIVLVFGGLTTLAMYEHKNPCLEWVETGKQVCSTHCVNTGQHSPPICNTSCSPERECVLRQMADGTIQER